MNTNAKKRLVIWGIILLVVINISAITTMFYRTRTPDIFPRFNNRNIRVNRNIQKNRNLRENRTSRDNYRREGAHMFFVRELDFSEIQLEKFKNINNKNYEDIHIIVKQLNAKRDEMITELENKTPNMAKLDSIAIDVGNLHTKLKKITINHYLEIKNICNPKQQEKLHMMYKHMSSTNCAMPDINNNRRERNKYRNQNSK